MYSHERLYISWRFIMMKIVLDPDRQCKNCIHVMHCSFLIDNPFSLIKPDPKLKIDIQSAYEAFYCAIAESCSKFPSREK
jgi:hypothetical protein